jgi:hypothetical protein
VSDLQLTGHVGPSRQTGRRCLLNIDAQLRQGFARWRAADKAKQNKGDEKTLEQTTSPQTGLIYRAGRFELRPELRCDFARDEPDAELSRLGCLRGLFREAPPDLTFVEVLFAAAVDFFFGLEPALDDRFARPEAAPIRAPDRAPATAPVIVRLRAPPVCLSACVAVSTTASCAAFIRPCLFFAITRLLIAASLERSVQPWDSN